MHKRKVFTLKGMYWAIDSNFSLEFVCITLSALQICPVQLNFIKFYKTIPAMSGCIRPKYEVLLSKCI